MSKTSRRAQQGLTVALQTRHRKNSQRISISIPQTTLSLVIIKGNEENHRNLWKSTPCESNSKNLSYRRGLVAREQSIVILLLAGLIIDGVFDAHFPSLVLPFPFSRSPIFLSKILRSPTATISGQNCPVKNFVSTNRKIEKFLKGIVFSFTRVFDSNATRVDA